jgi:SEC-C motif-containing protein
MSFVNKLCFCGSGKKYKKCCQTYHKGAIPQNALLLMKSRYSAYCVGDAKYIIKTTHQNNTDFTTNTTKWIEDIKSFTNNTIFNKLEIIKFIDGENIAYVEFKAYMNQNNKEVILNEKSKFQKVDKYWLYENGEFE